MIILSEKQKKERYKDLLNKDPEKLTEKQKDFILEMRIKEEFECGLEG